MSDLDYITEKTILEEVRFHRLGILHQMNQEVDGTFELVSYDMDAERVINRTKGPESVIRAQYAKVLELDGWAEEQAERRFQDRRSESREEARQRAEERDEERDPRELRAEMMFR